LTVPVSVYLLVQTPLPPLLITFTRLNWRPLTETDEGDST
jgi:hypothetical protein